MSSAHYMIKKYVLILGVACLPWSMAYADQDVIVKQGDSLAKIAKRVLGSEAKWQMLCDANRDVIGDDCVRIQPGMKLIVPSQDDDEVSSSSSDQNLDESEKESKDTEKDTKKDIGMGSQIKAQFFESKDGVFDFSFKNIKLDDTIFVTDGLVAKTSDEGLRISGFIAEPNANGLTSGLLVKLPDQVKAAISGKTIKIEYNIRAVDDVTSEIWMAYGTQSAQTTQDNDWVPDAVTTEFSNVFFEHDVPELAKVDHFVSILPDPEDGGQTIEVKSLKITILEPEV